MEYPAVRDEVHLHGIFCLKKKKDIDQVRLVANGEGNKFPAILWVAGNGMREIYYYRSFGTFWILNHVKALQIYKIILNSTS